MLKRYEAVQRMQRLQSVSRNLVRRLLRSNRGPAITTYRFDGPRATHLNVKPVTEEQLERFKAELAQKMRSVVLQYGPHDARVGLGTDYHPDKMLREAAEVAEIPTSNFPWKTHMWISSEGGGMVQVSAGYGAPVAVVFGDPIWAVPKFTACTVDYILKHRGDSYHAEDLKAYQSSCEQAISRLQDCYRHRGWPVADGWKVLTADATEGYDILHRLAERINGQIELAQQKPSPETYEAAIISYQRMGSHLAALAAVIGHGG